MGDFITQHGSALVIGLWFLLSGAVAVTGKLFWDKLGKMEKRQDEMEVDLKAIRGNYMDRFESVHECLANTKNEILEKIHELHILIVGSNKPKRRR